MSSPLETFNPHSFLYVAALCGICFILSLVALVLADATSLAILALGFAVAWGGLTWLFAVGGRDPRGESLRNAEGVR